MASSISTSRPAHSVYSPPSPIASCKCDIHSQTMYRGKNASGDAPGAELQSPRIRSPSCPETRCSTPRRSTSGLCSRRRCTRACSSISSCQSNDALHRVRSSVGRWCVETHMEKKPAKNSATHTAATCTRFSHSQAYASVASGRNGMAYFVLSRRICRRRCL